MGVVEPAGYRDCYTPTANQPWFRELVAHAVSPSTLGPLAVILERGTQGSFDGREHLGAVGRDIGATLQESQRARPWDGYSKIRILPIQSPKGTVQSIHETMSGRTKTIKTTEVQWLRLHASTAGGAGWIPGPGNIISHAKWCNLLKEIEAKLYFNKNFFLRERGEEKRDRFTYTHTERNLKHFNQTRATGRIFIECLLCVGSVLIKRGEW